jgi:hypothetical protein
MPIVLHRRNRLIPARLIEDWLRAGRKLGRVCGVAVLIALGRLRKKLLRYWAIRLGSTLVLIIGYVLLLAEALIQRLIRLSWRQRPLISRMRCRLLGSRNLVLELLLHSRGLHEALCWLQSMLMAGQRRAVLRRRLRCIGERPILRWRHGIAHGLRRGRDKTGLGAWLETSRELSRRKRDDRPTRVVGMLGVMVCYRRSSLLAAGHRGVY